MAPRLHDFPRWSLVPLVLATIGIGGLGARLVGAEFESSEREARAELEAKAAQGARAISDFVAATRTPEDGPSTEDVARVTNGVFEYPREPFAAMTLEPIPGRDVEGDFLLAEGARRELAGNVAGALDVLHAAAAESRDPSIRAIAGVRTAALHRGRGETDAADRAARDALAAMDAGTRDTAREALLLRHLATPTAPDLLAALSDLVGGPDDAFARALLDGSSDGARYLRQRELDLDRIARIRKARLDPLVGQTRAAWLGGRYLIATRIDEDTIDFRDVGGPRELAHLRLVDVTDVPDVPVAPEASKPSDSSQGGAGDDAGSLIARAPVGALLPGIFVEERRPRAEVEAAGRRRAWLVGALIGLTLVAFGAALAAIAAAARRERDAAAAKSDFVTRVGHDLRTPLALIRMYGETLAAGRVGDAAQARDFASVIARESERLTRLVSTVLDFARVNGAQPVRPRTRLDLASLAAEVASAHRPLAERAGMAITIEDPTVPLPVDADEDALRGALGNLFENALQHAASGRAIDVRCRRVANVAEIEIADRGPGVPESELERIFERFVRGSNVLDPGSKGPAGTGLGLALVHEVATIHGGAANARNRDGGGLVCCLRIPLAGIATHVNGRGGTST